jgi:hypothetical protein
MDRRTVRSLGLAQVSVRELTNPLNKINLIRSAALLLQSTEECIILWENIQTMCDSLHTQVPVLVRIVREESLTLSTHTHTHTHTHMRVSYAFLS